MRLSILAAALQELTPRERYGSEPDLAIEEWPDISRELSCPFIQLSSAFHPSNADVPPEALLDRFVNHDGPRVQFG